MVSGTDVTGNHTAHPLEMYKYPAGCWILYYIIPKSRSYHYTSCHTRPAVCSVAKFLVEHLPSGLINRASTPFKTVDKEWLAWPVLASCLVTEHTSAVSTSKRKMEKFQGPIQTESWWKSWLVVGEEEDESDDDMDCDRPTLPPSRFICFTMTQKTRTL